MSRADLPVGLQAAQAAHAGLELAVAHSELLPHWDGVLVLLSAADELELCWLLDRAIRDELHPVAFYEPDLGHELTAVAVLGGGDRLTARYPLLGKE